MVISFRTEILPDQSIDKISYADNLLFIGSCFSGNIGEKFKRLKFETEVNLFGVLFNPISISKSISLGIHSGVVSRNDLVFNSGLWSSFTHHSQFNSEQSDKTLDSINDSISQVGIAIKKAKWLFITFGTAWVYTYNKTGEIVANCHKISGKEFTKRLLSVEEITTNYSELLAGMKKVNPELKVVFTISPVRHWKDGVVGNQRSKSILHLVVANLEREFKNVSYFPAYELVIDDLRDYRFYKEDMLHPNNQAIKYIWDKLCFTYFDASTNHIIKEVQKILSSVNHKPFNMKSTEHQKFLVKQLEIINDLERKVSLNFSSEVESLKIQLV